MMGNDEFRQAFQNQQSQRPTQVDLVMIFEGMNKLPAMAFVQKASSGYIKRGRIFQASSAQVIIAYPDKGDAAHLAERMRQGAHLGLACGADVQWPGIRDKRAADMTKGWKEKIRKCLQ